jgi:hypothetical protein
MCENKGLAEQIEDALRDLDLPFRSVSQNGVKAEMLAPNAHI